MIAKIITGKFHTDMVDAQLNISQLLRHPGLAPGTPDNNVQKFIGKPILIHSWLNLMTSRVEREPTSPMSYG
jgi:hypothetical protein